MTIWNIIITSYWIPPLLILPVLGWGYFFYKKQPEKRKYVVLSFLAGMMSVLPIKIYEQYWYFAILWLKDLNMFNAIANLVHSQEIPTLLTFITTSIIVAVFIFLFTAAIMAVLEIFSGEDTVSTFWKKIKHISDTPFIFISVGMIIAIIAYSSSFSIHQKVWFFITVGLLEEYTKHLLLRFSDEDNIRSTADAVEFSVIVALGFAFVENIFYIYKSANNALITTPMLWVIIILRSSISIIAHITFSSISGYFYGVSRFSPEIDKLQERHPVIRFFHTLLHCKLGTVFKEEKMMEGMIFAIILHMLYNLLLEFQYITVVTILSVIMFIVINIIFKQAKEPANSVPSTELPNAYTKY